MSNKPSKSKSKTKITKISAKSAASNAKAKQPQVSTTKSPAKTTKPQTPKNTKTKAKTTEKPLKEVFILVRPFVAIGRYLRDSWREIRQVRWPNRKSTWKMTLAVLIYCAVFAVFILLLDTFFTFIFNLLLGTN